MMIMVIMIITVLVTNQSIDTKKSIEYQLGNNTNVRTIVTLLVILIKR